MKYHLEINTEFRQFEKLITHSFVKNLTRVFVHQVNAVQVIAVDVVKLKLHNTN